MLQAGRPGAPLLVLIHGGGVGPWMWRAHLEHFAATHHVVAPVLPGHDPHVPSEYTTHALAVADVVAQLPEGARDATVAGFSAGGQVAMLLAAGHPELVARLAVVSSLTRPLAGGATLASIAGWGAPLAQWRWFARAQAKQLFVPDELFGEYFETSRAISAASLRNVTRANFDFEAPELGSLPTLLMWGDREQRELREGMRELAQRVPGAATRVVPGAGHGIPLSDPDVFGDELALLLARSA